MLTTAMAKWVLVSFLALAAGPQNGGAAQYAGRWQIVGKSAAGTLLMLGIVEITAKDGRLAATVVSSPLPGFAIREVALADGQIVITFASTGSPNVTMKGRRVGDRLEGTIGEKDGDGSWSATLTASDLPQPPPATEDQKAFAAAMRAPRSERTAALDKFLRDFPQSPLRESARFESAAGIRDSEERQAALTRFLADFPDSRFRDQASYKLLDLIPDPPTRIAAQEKYLTEFPKGTMSENVYRSLLDAYLRNKPPDEAKISALIEAYLKSVSAKEIPSGQYTVNRHSDACNTVARRLAQNGVMLEKALELSREAVASAGGKVDPRTRSMYLATLGQVLYARKDLEKAEQALTMAIMASGGTPNTEASLYLGKIYETRNDDAAALNAYLQAASFSGSADIRESLERLYLKHYGSLAGLHEKLDAILLARPKPFDPGRFERNPSDGGRVVLAELFTGAECPPCVAADLAFDGILDRYNRATVAVLEYHLNIPGPDPMTNPDSELRAYYYNVAGTPGAVIDGIDRHFEERRANTAEENFKALRALIEPRLAEAPGATFSSLSLKKKAGKVSVSGEVSWPAADARNPRKLRLRIALVEETVHYTGSNGIHFHHMVVRKMLGPADGISLSGRTGKATFSESVSLAALETGLKAYLDRKERENAAQEGDFHYREKPYKINPGLLHAVVFVQDGETMQVMQTGHID
jgi:tetratricopeptide (TPR) repeat protein